MQSKKISYLTMTITMVFLVILTMIFLIIPGNSKAQEAYDHKIELATMTFEWRLTNDTIHVRLQAETTGWVGIGFNPSQAMKDANFILGYVKNHKVKVTNDFGITSRQHKPDTELGGESNITEIGGSEENGLTTINFTIPLDSGDEYDGKIFTDQENIVLLAYGSGRDSFKGKHKYRTSLKVNLGNGNFETIK